jgi:hypothetical protein
MHLDDRLHGVALRVRTRQGHRPPRRDVVALEAVSCRTRPRARERQAPLLIRSEEENTDPHPVASRVSSEERALVSWPSHLRSRGAIRMQRL